MDFIGEYQILEKIYESHSSLIYRAILKQNNQSIILKVLNENYPDSSAITHYKQEYEITHSLNVDSIIKAYGLQRYENSIAILLEDFGGQSLKVLTSQGKFSREDFLAIAIKITEALIAVHNSNIIHKDINPSNIVYNSQTKQLKIIDFGISSRLSQEFLTPLPPEKLEGTLAYIAPEQTGRMNRGIDYRSDFYSLGVSFYELLTNKLPFATTDPIELVHCHIAQQPLPVHQLIPEIPLAVSKLVSKLLAKNPEDRYQSAWGIKADLEICLNQLNAKGKINQFSLGSKDISDKFLIPQKLYGREQEVNQLLTAFEKISQGATEMILISGYSGIGKSALVNEIHKPITRQRGQFISGKFDQLQRDIPYSAIAQVFQDLTRKLLSETEARLQTWKKEILEALGNNGQIIIDVIPYLEKIIGKQPLVEQLGKTESQNRFNLFFQKFLNIFCQKEHPLVIFIDDLQWADLPSLNLIEQLISDPDNQYLLLIGAYRDNEVSSTHPLIHTLEKINQAQIAVNQITLPCLNIKHVNQLIADTLNCSTGVSKSLAELVIQKTGGNPFFLTQLLYSLYQENLLVFNPHHSFLISESNRQSYWQWDIAQIENVSITDNVVDLMVSKIEKLDTQTQHVLQLAACIGNHFKLEVLAIVNNKSQTATARELQSALDEGLIIPLEKNYKFPLLWNPEELLNSNLGTSFQNSTYIPYKFLHDRVQQAAYSLIPEAERKIIHLQIGRLLLQNIKDNDLENKIFDIVNQLNEGLDLIKESSEKKELAKLNLRAGKKAKSSTAYELSLIYLKSARKLLTFDSWENQYELTLDIYINFLESLYLNTIFDQIEELFNDVLQKCKNIFDRLKINQLKISYYYTTLQPQKAIETALNFLAELRIHLSSKTNNIELSIENQQKSIQLLLQDKSIDNLADLPKMTDQYKLAAINILQKIISATHTTNFSLFIEVILTEINLCIKYGNPPQSASIYAVYGMVLCTIKKDINNGYAFGKLSVKLLEEYKDNQSESFVMQMFYGQIWHWKKYLKDLAAQKHLLHAFKTGIDKGENEFSSYAIINYCLIKLLGGESLEEVNLDFYKYSCFIEKTKQEFAIYSAKIYYKLTIILSKSTKNYFLILGDSLEEENQYLKEWIQANNEWLLSSIYLAKAICCYYLKDYIHAYSSSINANKYSQATSSYLTAPQQNFYSSLAYIFYYNSCEINQQENLLTQVDNNQINMKKWASYCPENFQHKYDLVEAEKARVLGDNWQAAELYDQAIQGAKKYEFIHEEALAYERAAEFYLELGRIEIGQLYLRNAHHCYSRWGAKAKVAQLEEEYPEYLLGITQQGKSTQLSTTISTTGADGEILDLGTILKASQAISGEIKLDKLLQNLMKITIENAGAQTAFLILNHEGNWVIEAQGTVEQEQVTVLESIPVESIDSESSTPILPTTIINYVARTQESLVLNNATDEGQFINDPYIIATQSKSILCTPLLNQGQLRGIVYLENNLTTGVFTSERVELLNILSTQAAISIDNSRLYQTLEERVEERTRELSQTLDVLKATQAELIFENDLLKNNEPSADFDYQVGGSLAMDSPTYVVRSADRNLYKALQQGEFCYILNARQMGKSSLMVRMMNHLNHEGFSCGAIDMTRIGSENVTPEQWYKGIAIELWRSLGLFGKVNLKTWWNERKDLSPVQRLSHFIEEVLLVALADEDSSNLDKLVIFIDEIDCVLGLEFSVNDFFALIRSCYNQRTLDPNYHRLTFALFGVATPADLISDRRKTPFNIGQAVHLEGFKEHEAQPLLYGLTDKVNNPQVILKEVLKWTCGQPFLTQKICRLILDYTQPIPPNQEAEWIENLVQLNIINDWEFQDEPEHLKTIRDRILKNEYNPQKLLELYQKVLHQDTVESTGSFAESELLLSGLITKQQGTLKVSNRIYQLIFDSVWIQENCYTLT